MLQSFHHHSARGFESFLLVAVIFSYLRKSGQRQLAPAVYWAIGVALGVSGGLGYLLFQMQTARRVDRTASRPDGRGFLGNEALREAILGSIAIAMVASFWLFTCGAPDKTERENGRTAGRSFYPPVWLDRMAGSFFFSTV